MATPQTEYLLALSNINFPFLTEHAICSLFGDLYILLENSVDDLYMDSFSSDGTSVDFVITDGATTIIDTSAATETASSWNGTWKTFRFDQGKIVAQAVINTERLQALGTVNYTGLGLKILPHNYDVAVKQLLLLNGLEEDVTLKGGYNVTYSVDTDIDNTSRITINAIPGTGLGKAEADCVGEDDLLRSINGVQADEFGNLKLNAEDCYWTYNSFSPSANTIFFQADCFPCLDCNSVFDTYTSLKKIYRDAVFMRQRLCDAMKVYLDYLYLVNKFRDEWGKLKFVPEFIQTDDELYDIVFRLTTGAKDISSIVVNISYAGEDIEIEYDARSGFVKLPDFAWRQATAEELDFGKKISYSGDALKSFKFAVWYWTMSFLGQGTNDVVTLNWDVTITFVDGSTPYTDSGTATLQIQLPTNNNN